MQELVVNRKFAEAADIQKEIDQLRSSVQPNLSMISGMKVTISVQSYILSLVFALVENWK